MTFEPIDFREMLAAARKEARRCKVREEGVVGKQLLEKSLEGKLSEAGFLETRGEPSGKSSLRQGGHARCTDSARTQEGLIQALHSRSGGAGVSVKWLSPTFLFNLLQKQKPLVLGSSEFPSSGSPDTAPPFVLLDCRSFEDFRRSHVAQALHAQSLLDELLHLRSDAQLSELHATPLPPKSLRRLRFVVYTNPSQFSSSKHSSDSDQQRVENELLLLAELLAQKYGATEGLAPSKQTPVDLLFIRGGFDSISFSYPFLCVSGEEESAFQKRLTAAMGRALMSYPSELLRKHRLESGVSLRDAEGSQLSSDNALRNAAASEGGEVPFPAIFVGTEVHARSAVIRRCLRICHIIDLTAQGLAASTTKGNGASQRVVRQCLCGASSDQPFEFRLPALRGEKGAVRDRLFFENLKVSDLIQCLNFAVKCLAGSTLLVASEDSVGSKSFVFSLGASCLSSAPPLSGELAGPLAALGWMSVHWKKTPILPAHLRLLHRLAEKPLAGEPSGNGRKSQEGSRGTLQLAAADEAQPVRPDIRNPCSDFLWKRKTPFLRCLCVEQASPWPSTCCSLERGAKSTASRLFKTAIRSLGSAEDDSEGFETEEAALRRRALSALFKGTCLSAARLLVEKRRCEELRTALSWLCSKETGLCSFPAVSEIPLKTGTDDATKKDEAGLLLSAWQWLRLLSGLAVLEDQSEDQLSQSEFEKLFNFLEVAASQAPCECTPAVAEVTLNCAILWRDTFKLEAQKASSSAILPLFRALSRFVESHGEGLLALSQDAALAPRNSRPSPRCAECGEAESESGSLFGISCSSMRLVLAALSGCLFPPLQENANPECGSLRLAFRDSQCAATVQNLALAAAAGGSRPSLVSSDASLSSSHSFRRSEDALPPDTLQEALKPFVIFLDDEEI